MISLDNLPLNVKHLYNTLASDNLILSRYNDVLFPENHYYNSDALPVEWMEIFDPQETFRALDRESELSDVFEYYIHANKFSQSCDREQINMTEEPRSFFNKTILGAKYSKMSRNRPMSTNPTDFIRRNKEYGIEYKIKYSKTNKG